MIRIIDDNVGLALYNKYAGLKLQVYSMHARFIITVYKMTI